MARVREEAPTGAGASASVVEASSPGDLAGADHLVTQVASTERVRTLTAPPPPPSAYDLDVWENDCHGVDPDPRTGKLPNDGACLVELPIPIKIPKGGRVSLPAAYRHRILQMAPNHLRLVEEHPGEQYRHDVKPSGTSR